MLAGVPRVLRLVAACALTVAAVLPSSAGAKVPQGFFGVMVDGPATETPGILEREAPRIRAAGAQTVRFAIDWASAQPYATAAEVPEAERARFTDVDGVPTDLSRSDRIVQLLAAQGLRPLPVILHAPDWAAKFPGSLLTDPRRYASPPSGPEPYARFVAALARRYGPTGSLWSTVPPQRRRPIRTWQVWNEMNLNVFWNEPDFQKGYVPLLRATRAAVRAVDPRALIATGGLTNGSVPAWTALRRIYEAGGRGSFDVVAIHPYTRSAAGVLATVRATRRVTAARGQRTIPIVLTEVAFSSSGGDSPDARRFATWDTTERGQADRLRSTFRLLARQRRALGIGGVSWYTWLSPQARRANWSSYAGLSRLSGDRIVRKPALLTYRTTVRELSR